MSLDNFLTDLPAPPAQRRQLVLAIDYDQTLDCTPWPGVGLITPAAKVVMRLLAEEGHKLIIWTCRSERALEDALANLRRQDVPYDYANQNCPEIIAEWGGSDSRKIFADLYLDDRAALLQPGGINWIDFYQQVNRLASQAA